MKKIESIEQLKKLANNDNGIDCFISLAGGMARSSKVIKYTPEDKIFYVINEIDNSEQELNEKQLKTKSNIALAIENSAMWQY